jgi:hypothetical protein
VLGSVTASVTPVMSVAVIQAVAAPQLLLAQLESVTWDPETKALPPEAEVTARVVSPATCAAAA